MPMLTPMPMLGLGLRLRLLRGLLQAQFREVIQTQILTLMVFTTTQQTMVALKVCSKPEVFLQVHNLTVLKNDHSTCQNKKINFWSRPVGVETTIQLSQQLRNRKKKKLLLLLGLKQQSEVHLSRFQILTTILAILCLLDSCLTLLTNSQLNISSKSFQVVPLFQCVMVGILVWGVRAKWGIPSFSQQLWATLGHNPNLAIANLYSSTVAIQRANTAMLALSKRRIVSYKKLTIKNNRRLAKAGFQACLWRNLDPVYIKEDPANQVCQKVMTGFKTTPCKLALSHRTFQAQ